MSELKHELSVAGGDDRVCHERPFVKGGDDRVCHERPFVKGGDDRVCHERPFVKGGDDRVCHERTLDNKETTFNGVFFKVPAYESVLSSVEQAIRSAKIKI